MVCNFEELILLLRILLSVSYINWCYGLYHCTAEFQEDLNDFIKSPLEIYKAYVSITVDSIFADWSLSEKQQSYGSEDVV